MTKLWFNVQVTCSLLIIKVYIKATWINKIIIICAQKTLVEIVLDLDSCVKDLYNLHYIHCKDTSKVPNVNFGNVYIKQTFWSIMWSPKSLMYIKFDLNLYSLVKRYVNILTYDLIALNYFSHTELDQQKDKWTFQNLYCLYSINNHI